MSDFVKNAGIVLSWGEAISMGIVGEVWLVRLDGLLQGVELDQDLVRCQSILGELCPKSVG